MSAILTTLDFTGVRKLTIQSVTTPALKKGHPFGGNTTVHGLRKYAEVELQCGGAGTYSFLVQSLWNAYCLVTGNDGQVERFVAEKTYGDHPRRVDGSTVPWLHHDGKLYLPGSVVRSVAHCYRMVDGSTVDNATVDGVWTRGDKAPRTQQIADPAMRFIRWRNYLLSNVASVKVGEAVTAGEAVERFKTMLEGLTTAEIAADFAKLPAVTVDG